MKVQILDEAEQDLIDGFRFYEAQNQGIGDYFLDSLFSDIESLQLLRGHPRATLRLLSPALQAFSLSRFTIELRERLCVYTPFWTADEIRHGSKNGWIKPDQHKKRYSPSLAVLVGCGHSGFHESCPWFHIGQAAGFMDWNVKGVTCYITAVIPNPILSREP